MIVLREGGEKRGKKGPRESNEANGLMDAVASTNGLSANC